MTNKNNFPNQKYVFGPVPSRRLGRSLGVDLVPFKTCTLDCRYCECGHTTNLTLERKIYVPVDEVSEELRDRLPALKGNLDFITFSGSGEPTLSTSIPDIIEVIRELSTTPLAMLTNGTLLHQPDVIRDITDLDVIIPSLDTIDPALFRQLNQPHGNLDFYEYLHGLRQLRSRFKGRIWLEVLLCKGINDDPDHLADLGKEIRRIQPDAVQLNTVFRPGAEPDLLALSEAEMKTAESIMGITAQPYASIPQDNQEEDNQQLIIQQILEIITRRPCTVEDLASGLSYSSERIQEALDELSKQDRIHILSDSGGAHYSTRNWVEHSDDPV
jgi:wyosine [tRNA(Phe)-imidazoG37] synthetase (radical SAM superfamily)